jgi:hypothetical protein
MKRLFALFLFALATTAAICGSIDEEGPNLIVSSVAGNLETGRASNLMIEISNNAITGQTQAEQEELGVERSKALAIMAQLISRDDRLKVLSGAQPGGSLAAGENRTLVFAVQPKKEAELGIYPLELFLSYDNLTDIAISEDQSLIFIYENATKTMPLEAQVSFGPKISIKDVRGTIVPGKESQVKVVISNQGDEMAKDLQIEVEAREPFQNSTVSRKLGDLKPGKSVSAEINLEALTDLGEGFYALPTQLSYVANGFSRKEDTAMILEVQNVSWLRSMILPALALMFLAAGIYVGVKIYRKPKRKRKL